MDQEEGRFNRVLINQNRIYIMNEPRIIEEDEKQNERSISYQSSHSTVSMVSRLSSF